MKNLLILLISLGVFQIGKTQGLPEIIFPGYGFTQTSYPAYGAILSDTITNRGTTPAEFYFNHVDTDSFGSVIEEKKKLFFSDDSFLVWVYHHGMAADPDERRLEYIRALARFYKNDKFFRNYLNIAGGWNAINPDTAFAKVEAINASNTSHRNQQCGDFATHAMRALYRMYQYQWDTFATSPDLYRTIGLDGHSIFESYFHGKWAFVDTDPGTPGFMFPDSGGRYWSTQDLVDSPIRASANWVSVKSESGFPLINTWFFDTIIMSEEYRIYFSNTGPAKFPTSFREKVKNFPVQPEQVSGVIILPPGGSLVFHYINDAVNMYLGNQNLQSQVDTFFYIESQFEQGTIDSLTFLNYCSNIFNIPSSEVFGVIQRNAFGSFLESWKPHWEKDGILPPLVEYILPGNQDSLIIGTDISGPFMVVDVKTVQDMNIGEIAIADSFHFDLWDESNTGGPKNWNQKNLNYLTNGTIAAGTVAQIKCAYNPGWIQWWDGYSIDQLGLSDTLELRRSNGFFASSIVTALPVTLLFIKTKPCNRSIFLTWATSIEINNDKFIVQRSSKDCCFFETIGSVAGSGNSSSEKKYSFEDENLSEGLYYYRIIQVDFDGLETLSDIVSGKIPEEPYLVKTDYFNILGQSVSMSMDGPKFKRELLSNGEKRSFFVR